MDTYAGDPGRDEASAGSTPGIHTGNPAYAARMIKMGFNMVTLSNDSGIMLNAAKAAVKVARG